MIVALMQRTVSCASRDRPPQLDGVVEGVEWRVLGAARAMTAVGTSDTSQLTFEEALAELEAIVRRLEEGSGKLDDAIAAYERGAMLKRHCEAKLQQAQMRIEKVVLGPDGTATLEPADLD